MNEIREVLRAWLAGAGLRTAAERAGVDRKTARRYVEAGEAAGLVRDGGEGQLTDELIGAVVAAVKPARATGHGAAWEDLVGWKEQIASWVEADLQLTNIHGKLERQGVVVPYRTLHRFATEQCDFGAKRITLRVADGKPGVECQIDFGRLGLMHDPASGRRRPVHALIFTAVYSRHMFVHLSFTGSPNEQAIPRIRCSRPGPDEDSAATPSHSASAPTPRTPRSDAPLWKARRFTHT